MKFRSKYTDEDKDITPAQYLAEFITERKYSKAGKTLPVRFWNVPPFKSTFFHQLKLANKLLNEYSIQVILSTLRELKYVYSLANKKLITVIRQNHVKQVAQPLVSLCEAIGLNTEVVTVADQNMFMLDITAKRSLRSKLE